MTQDERSALSAAADSIQSAANHAKALGHAVDLALEAMQQALQINDTGGVWHLIELAESMLHLQRQQIETVHATTEAAYPGRQEKAA